MCTVSTECAGELIPKVRLWPVWAEHPKHLEHRRGTSLMSRRSLWFRMKTQHGVPQSTAWCSDSMVFTRQCAVDIMKVRERGGLRRQEFLHGLQPSTIPEVGATSEACHSGCMRRVKTIVLTTFPTSTITLPQSWNLVFLNELVFIDICTLRTDPEWHEHTGNDSRSGCNFRNLSLWLHETCQNHLLNNLPNFYNVMSTTLKPCSLNQLVFLEICTLRTHPERHEHMTNKTGWLLTS